MTNDWILMQAKQLNLKVGYVKLPSIGDKEDGNS